MAKCLFFCSITLQRVLVPNDSYVNFSSSCSHISAEVIFFAISSLQFFGEGGIIYKCLFASKIIKLSHQFNKKIVN